MFRNAFLRTQRVSDLPVRGAKVGFADFLLMPQPPLLTRRGLFIYLSRLPNQFQFIDRGYRQELEIMMLKVSSAVILALSVSLSAAQDEHTGHNFASDFGKVHFA